MQRGRRLTENKMPKAYIGYIGECFTEHFHSLTMANRLHSHVSQGLFSLLVKLNDLDSGFETSLLLLLPPAVLPPYLAHRHFKLLKDSSSSDSPGSVMEPPPFSSTHLQIYL